MIEALSRNSLATTAYHCTVIPDHLQLLASLDLDALGIEEVLEDLRQRGVSTSIQEFFFSPFHRTADTSQRFQSRFSDGSWPIKYSALEPATSLAECQHTRKKYVLNNGTRSATLVFSTLSFSFSGDVKDLRPKKTDWPFLTSDDGYDTCNQIAREARTAGLSGLLTPSARAADGTCLPIFKADATKDPAIIASAKYGYDATTKEWASA